MTPTVADLDVAVTSVVETRVVEATLGARYADDAAYRYEATPRTGRGPVDVLVPHRVRALYRRAVATWLGDRPGWELTQVIVIGRSALALVRWEAHVVGCRQPGPDCAACAPPVERQRTYASLAAAPDWVGDVVRALADADPPTAGRRLHRPDLPTAPTADRGGRIDRVARLGA